jgi:hypothetical protein
MRRLLPPLLLLALGLAVAGARADEASEPAPKPRIYRWVDANGVAHYTTEEDRIPPSLRRRFGLPTQPLERKPIDARAPGAAEEAAPAPEPAAGLDAWASEERGTEPVAAPEGAAAPESAAPPAAAPEWSDDDASLPPVAASATGDVERLAQVELRMAELSAAIAADEDALSAWIGDRQGGDPIELGGRPEFREIATRLPKRIQELEALRRERDALESATP